MRRRFTRRVGPALAVAMLLSMTLPWMAVADDISNSLDTSVDASVEVMTLTVGGGVGATNLVIIPQNNDEKPGCNLTRSKTLEVEVVSANPAVATVSPSLVTFESCGQTPRITVTPLGAGKTNITLRQLSNTTEGSFNLVPAAFDVVVTSNDSTGPVITPHVSGTQGSNGWYIGATTVNWTVIDNESPISSRSGCDQMTVSVDTVGQLVACTATSAGGTTSQSVTIKLDATGPTDVALSPNTTPTGLNGWYIDDVTITTVGGDEISGPVTCTPVQSQTTETAGTTFAGTCTNQAGLTTHAASLAVKLDKSRPSAEVAVVSGTAGENGWHTSDVTIRTSGTDSISGPVTCTSDQQQIAETTGQEFTGSCTNDAGLSATAEPLTVKLDRTGPSNPALSVVSGVIGLNGWYTSDVTVRTTGDEDISNPMACTPDRFLTDDTTSSGQLFTGSCANDAGLTSHADPLAVMRDTTAPTITATATVDGQPYAGEWTNQDVVVGFSCDDPQPGSGINEVCPSDVTVDHSTGTDGQLVAANVMDNAGNQATSDVVTVRVDKDVPTITAIATTANGQAYTGGWTNQTVTVRFDCADQGGSGLDGACPSPVVVAADTAVTGQGVSASISDIAGNQMSSNEVVVFVDTTAPVITAQGAQLATPNGQNDWYTVPVNETFQAQDGGSGFVGRPDPYTFTRSSGAQEGSVVAINSGTVADAAGNVNPGSDSVAYKIDLSDPTNVAGAPDRAPDANGWYNHGLNVVFTGSDDVSGIDSCTNLAYTGPDGTDLTATGTCADHAGRLSAPVASASFNYDATDPTNVQFTAGPEDGAIYYYGDPIPSAACTADDAMSGLDDCQVTDVAGANGVHTLTATATDVAGNQATANRSYTVKPWTFKGFYQPIDMTPAGGDPAYNTVKAGSTVPFKFELFKGATELTSTSDVKSIAASKFTCQTGTTETPIDVTATGGTSLRYDTTAGQYVYNWKTPTTTGCYAVTITAQDGSSQTAFFKLK